MQSDVDSGVKGGKWIKDIENLFSFLEERN